MNPMGGNGPAVDRSDLLRDCLIFRALDEAGRRAFAEKGMRLALKSGQPLFHLGDRGTTMVVIAKGNIRVFLPTPPGKDITLADLGRGAVIGEVALLDDEPRSASAIALSNCEVLQFDRSTVLPLLSERPAVAMALIKLLCERLRRSDERMLEIGTRPLSARLAKTLLDHTNGARSAQPKLSLTQSELADMVGSTRESVNRTLRSWQHHGLIDLRDGWIWVVRHDELSAIAGRY